MRNLSRNYLVIKNRPTRWYLHLMKLGSKYSKLVR